MKRLRALALALLGLLWLNLAFAQTASSISLSDQQVKTFTLSASSFTTAFFFDLPAGTSRFKVELTGNAASGDSGTPKRYSIVIFNSDIQ